MPNKLESCINQISKKYNNGKYNPWAICISSTGLKPERKNKSNRRKK